MRIIFLGPPGVGKGTYTSRIKERYGIPHISTGDIFRENIVNKTELGIEANKYMSKGHLVPDELTINMLRERLTHPDAKKGFILDGFPRTVKQAEELEKFSHIDIVISFVADDDILVKRLSGRRTCRNCKAIYHISNKVLIPKVPGKCDRCGGELYQREDEKPDVIKDRLVVYKKQTQPLVNYYGKKGILKEIDANTEDIPVIVDKVVEILDKFK